MIFSLLLVFTYSSAIFENVTKQMEQCLINENLMETVSSKDVNFGSLKNPDYTFVEVARTLRDFSCKDELKKLKKVADICINLAFSCRIVSECEYYFHGLQEVKTHIDKYLKTLNDFGDSYQDIIYYTDQYLKSYNELISYLTKLRHTSINYILKTKLRPISERIVIDDLKMYDDMFIRLLSDLTFKFKSDIVGFRKIKTQYKNLKYQFWISDLNQSISNSIKGKCIVVSSELNHKLSVYFPYKDLMKKVTISLSSITDLSNLYWESRKISVNSLKILSTHFNILDMYNLFIKKSVNITGGFIKIFEKELSIGNNNFYSRNMSYANFRDLKKFLKVIPQDFTIIEYIYSILKKLDLENEVLSMALDDPIYKLILKNINHNEPNFKDQLLKYILFSQLQDLFMISNHKNRCSVKLERLIYDLKTLISLTPDKLSENIFLLSDLFDLYLIKERQNVFDFMSETSYDILTGIETALDDEDTQFIIMDNIYCIRRN